VASTGNGVVYPASVQFGTTRCHLPECGNVTSAFQLEGETRLIRTENPPPGIRISVRWGRLLVVFPTTSMTDRFGATATIRSCATGCALAALTMTVTERLATTRVGRCSRNGAFPAPDATAVTVKSDETLSINTGKRMRELYSSARIKCNPGSGIIPGPGPADGLPARCFVERNSGSDPLKKIAIAL
jgi:hypothetical protein